MALSQSHQFFFTWAFPWYYLPFTWQHASPQQGKRKREEEQDGTNIGNDIVSFLPGNILVRSKTKLGLSHTEKGVGSYEDVTTRKWSSLEAI
jgi:hypothetical protein